MAQPPGMRAALCERYGGAETVRVAEVPRPVPGAGEVLVRIMASTLDSGDRRVRSLDMPAGFGLLARPALGFTRPRQPILGTCLAGQIEAVGAGVSRFRPGDAVIGSTGARMGCHAEFRVMREGDALVPKPASLGFDEAVALVFGGMAARHFLIDKAAVQAGDRVLVVGAGGSVGSMAVQIARAAGAHVTALCSAGKAEWVRALGAHDVLDSGRDVTPAGGATGFDLIIDTVGHNPVRAWLPLLPRGGRLCAVAASLPDMLAAPVLSAASGRRVLAGMVPDTAAKLAGVMALAEQGAIRPAIGASFPLEAARDAHALIDQGHKTGSLVITMAGA